MEEAYPPINWKNKKQSLWIAIFWWGGAFPLIYKNYIEHSEATDMFKGQEVGYKNLNWVNITLEEYWAGMRKKNYVLKYIFVDKVCCNISLTLSFVMLIRIFQSIYRNLSDVCSSSASFLKPTLTSLNESGKWNKFPYTKLVYWEYWLSINCICCFWHKMSAEDFMIFIVEKQDRHSIDLWK